MHSLSMLIVIPAAGFKQNMLTVVPPSKRHRTYFCKKKKIIKIKQTAERVQLQVIHDYWIRSFTYYGLPGVWPSKMQNYTVGKLLIMQAEKFSVKMDN